jgi:deoxyhypusine synthase
LFCLFPHTLSTCALNFSPPFKAVLLPSAPLPDGTPVIKGWDFNDGASLDGIMAAMLTTGCQASALGQAVNEVNRMVRKEKRER